MTLERSPYKMKVGDLVFHKSFNFWGPGILVSANNSVGMVPSNHTFRVWWQSGHETVDHFYNLSLVRNDKSRNSSKNNC